MRFSLPYHTGALEFDVPAREGVRIVGDSYPAPIENLPREIERTLDSPVAARPLNEMIPPSGAVSILVSDLTRGGSTGRILRHLLEFLEKWGAGSDRVSVVLALGMHRGHTAEELRDHLGAEVIGRWRVLEHDARDGVSLVDIGTTPRGTRCLINREVVESRLVIALGTVSFHYFAGYGGARKLILPGVAGESTIIANHRLSLRKDPGQGLSEGCRPGNLEGNPVHEDMLAGARLLEARLFAINVVGDDRGRAVFINAGELDASHREACRFLSEHFCFSVDHRYKAVIVSAGGSPRDINLLQSHKALRHASFALDEGGLMLAAAACPEGVGSVSYSAAFDGGRHGVPDSVRRNYTLNAQAAISTLELTACHSIYLRSEMSDDVVSRFGLCPWKEHFMEYLLDGIADDDILIIRNASNFLPSTELIDA